jgi:hypothetical protein
MRKHLTTFLDTKYKGFQHDMEDHFYYHGWKMKRICAFLIYTNNRFQMSWTFLDLSKGWNMAGVWYVSFPKETRGNLFPDSLCKEPKSIFYLRSICKTICSHQIILRAVMTIYLTMEYNQKILVNEVAPENSAQPISCLTEIIL